MVTPVITAHQLDNGLRVVLAPDDRVPVVSISLWYLVGSSHEPAGRGGFAHLFEHMMFAGSAHVAKGEHFGAIEAVGGRTNAYTGLDATVYSETVPSHELELALWLEADRMATLGQAMSQEKLDIQRDVVKNERRKRVDNLPYGTWEERVFALAFPSAHPYHHSSWGSMDELSAASLDDVRSFFADHYVPENAVLAIVGDVDVEPTLELVSRHFGPIERGTDRGAPTDPAFGAVAAASAREEISEAVPLPRIYLGCPIPPLGDDGFDVADLITDLFATGRGSRLQARLVREQRVAQIVQAWTFPLVGGASLLLIEATARPDVAPSTLEAALFGELDRLAADAPAAEELARVRLQRETNRALDRERSEERADRIGMYAALLDDPARFGTEAARDAAIDGAAVSASAREWLGSANRACVWYLPSDG